MDDPVVARDAFAAGEVHTLWGTVDMMTLVRSGTQSRLAHGPEGVAASRLVQRRRWYRGSQHHQIRQ